MAEDQIREVFRVCDKDGDGIVSLADMQLVMKEFGRNVPVVDLEAALSRLDANGDGEVRRTPSRCPLSQPPCQGTRYSDVRPRTAACSDVDHCIPSLLGLPCCPG